MDGEMMSIQRSEYLELRLFKEFAAHIASRGMHPATFNDVIARAVASGSFKLGATGQIIGTEDGGAVAFLDDLETSQSASHLFVQRQAMTAPSVRPRQIGSQACQHLSDLRLPTLAVLKNVLGAD